MATWKQLQRSLAFAAGISLLAPATVWTEETSPAPASAKATNASPKLIVPDVVLSREGVLRGSLVDGKKQPLTKTPVKLTQAGKWVATVETNDKGEYTLPGLKTGAYLLEIQEQRFAIRVWRPAAAPPKAMQQLNMAYISDKEVVRAQLGYLDPVNTSLLLLGVAGVIIGGVAISELEDLEDDIKSLQSP